MTYELQLRNGSGRVKVRSPWAAALLPLATLGVYHLVWWYRISRELRDFGRATGHDLGRHPTRSALALFPGGLLVIPMLITYWRTTRRVQEASRLGRTEPLNGWIALCLYVMVAPAMWAYVQFTLNKLWISAAQTARGTTAADSGSASPPRSGRLAHAPPTQQHGTR